MIPAISAAHQDTEFLAAMGITPARLTTPPSPPAHSQGGAARLARAICGRSGVYQLPPPPDIAEVAFMLDVDKPIAPGDLLLCMRRTASGLFPLGHVTLLRVLCVLPSGDLHADEQGAGFVEVTYTEHGETWLIFGVITKEKDFVLPRSDPR
jgi:hypothetical protein